MGQTSTERLRDYLAQLPPKAQALLMREFERALARGEDTAVATFVLGELRKVVRGPGAAAVPRVEDAARLVFATLESFLVDGNGPLRPGQIRRASLLPVWQWLQREGAAESIRALEAGLATPTPESEREQLVRKVQFSAVEAIERVMASGGDPRALARIGGPGIAEDLPAIAAVLKARDALDGLAGRLPRSVRVLGETQIAAVQSALNVPSLQTRQLLPFALSLVMSRLAAPWQIVRLAIAMAASDDEIRVAATPYGVAVTMAIHDLARIGGNLRADIKRGRFDNVSDHLKTVHDGVRGLRTELDVRSDSAWGKQIAAIRVDISNALQTEIDSVPGRVRRLLRQRPDKDISASARIDQLEVDEAVALIEFVAVCRTYASELAINEVTLRTFSDLQHYVEQATETLVGSLRGGDARARAFRRMQADAAIRFCEVLFGNDYASLMRRAAGQALAGERKTG
jgi:hypothetical protein